MAYNKNIDFQWKNKSVSLACEKIGNFEIFHQVIYTYSKKVIL